MHERIKSFAEGALAELLASERSVVVSFPFLWERASAPTGCSPRDPSRLLAIGPDLPGTDLLSCFFFQAICQRRQGIFDRLLVAYATSQKVVANLKRRSEAHAAEIAQLQGKLHRLPSFDCCRADSNLCAHFLSVAASALPEVEALKKRVAELEDQLIEWNYLFDEATQVRSQLHLAEVELKSTVERLTSELSSLRMAHQAELNRLLEARMTVEESIQQERNEDVRKLEVATNAHQQALVAARKQDEVALADMHEMDGLIAGKIS